MNESAMALSPLSRDGKRLLLNMVDRWLDRQLGQVVELEVEQGVRAVPDDASGYMVFEPSKGARLTIVINDAEGCDNG